MVNRNGLMRIRTVLACVWEIHFDSLWRTPAEMDAVPSIGTVVDPFYNAVAEAVNGCWKVQLVWGPECPGACRSVEKLELQPRYGPLAQQLTSPRLLGRRSTMGVSKEVLC